MAVNLGLIGAGRMGTALGTFLARGRSSAHLLAVADPARERALALAASAQIEARNAHASIDELLHRDDIHAVVVATPTNTHADLVARAAAAGKHIFVEKPLALTLPECRSAVAAVDAAGVQMMVGFMRRYDSAYVQAKQLIDSGDMGEPVMIKLVGRDMGPVPPEFARRAVSGGLIADMAIHDFDLARWLMRSEVMRVSTEGACRVYPELGEAGDIDNAVINLKFANNSVGNVDVSRNAVFGYDVRTEIVCSKGSLFVGSHQQSPLLVMKRNQIVHDAMPGFMERFSSAYVAELEDFARCIETGVAVPITGHDATAATAIALAATRSLDEGRVVELSEIE